MGIPQPRYSKEDFALRGDDIYERNIYRARLRGHRGRPRTAREHRRYLRRLPVGASLNHRQAASPSSRPLASSRMEPKAMFLTRQESGSGVKTERRSA